MGRGRARGRRLLPSVAGPEPGPWIDPKGGEMLFVRDAGTVIAAMLVGPGQFFVERYRKDGGQEEAQWSAKSSDDGVGIALYQVWRKRPLYARIVLITQLDEFLTDSTWTVPHRLADPTVEIRAETFARIRSWLLA